jgi:hypothetical protein
MDPEGGGSISKKGRTRSFLPLRPSVRNTVGNGEGGAGLPAGHGASSSPAREPSSCASRSGGRGPACACLADACSVRSEFLGDEVVAASVLDRFLHFATVFTCSGESYRLKEANRRRAAGK